MQLRRNRIRFSKINHIFISHLHGDHIFGLYGLISTFNLTGRKLPLSVYAPQGYDHILMSHLADFDIYPQFEIRFNPLKGNSPERILDEKHVTVTAFPLQHRVPTYGFLFMEKKAERKIIKEAIEKYSIPISEMRFIKSGADFIASDGSRILNKTITTDPPRPLSYAYCSDTAWFPRLSHFVKGVDLLYHEATFDSSKRDLARKTGHSTAEEAAITARDANAGTLLIGHFSSRYRDVSPLLDEARAIFPNVVAADEGLIIDIAGCRETL